MNATTIQLWPAGRQVTYRGDYWAKNIEVQQGRGEEATWQVADDTTAREIRINELAKMYQDRDVLACQSCLIGHLMENEVDGFSYDNVTRRALDPDEMDREECEDWLDEHDVDHPSTNEKPEGLDIDAMSPQELLTALVDRGSSKWYDEEDEDQLAKVVANLDDCRRELEVSYDDEDTILEEYRDAVRREINNGYHHAEDCDEIYEWWLVTDWLAQQLIAIGENVLDNDYGNWWGRTCTGQGMIMDGTLQAVAAKFVN